MTPREMQNAFELEYAKYDSDQMLESHVIFYWLNEAQEREFKTRYTGTNGSFEENQKRTDDLRTLVKETMITTTNGTVNVDKPNSHIVSLPTDYFTTVGEEVNIQYTPQGGILTTRRVEVTTCTSDTYSRDVTNPFSRHNMHYENANPLRLYKQDTIEVISDGNYTVPQYFLRYIKMPSDIVLGGIDCELPEHMHSEIITKAVNLLLENSTDARYQSNKNELREQE